MPTFQVQDAKGRTLELEGDHQPTEQELKTIFSQSFPETPKAPDPYSWWAQPLNVPQGSFNEAFTPPRAVQTALDKVWPEFEPNSPAEAVSEKVKGAVGSVLSPGGVVMLATAPVAPALLGGVTGVLGGQAFIEGVKEQQAGAAEGSPAKVAGGVAQSALGALMVAGGAKAVITPLTTKAVQSLVPESHRLPAPRTRMPEFTQSTLEPEGPPRLALPAPGEATGDITLPASELGPRTAGYRIQLPIEPESAKAARNVWAKPIDVEAQVEGIDAIRQLASMAEEQKTAGEPYQPPSINVDLRQLERVMQRNTVSKVESWADETIQGKLKGASANPFLDPELLAAAAVKGAILFKRGVTKAAEWNAEMRKQFGVGLEEVLPKIYQQSKDYWEAKENKPAPAVAEQAPEAPAPATAAVSEASAGVADTTPSPSAISEPNPSISENQPTGLTLPPPAQNALDTLTSLRSTARQVWQNRDVRKEMAIQRDVGDNAARLFGREQANDIRGDLRRLFPDDQQQAETSLAFVVEARGNFDNLDAMRTKLARSERADQKWRNEATGAIDWAKEHWEELAPLAERYEEKSLAQVDAENAAGIPTLKRSGYVMHAQDVDEGILSGGGEPSAFKKVRTFDTFADSIAAGIDPKTLNALDLMESRLSAGQRMINSRAWLDGLKEMKDAQGTPLGTDPIKVTRADGSTYQDAPSGYHMEYFGRTPIAIRNGFEGVFRSLTDPSAWDRSAFGRIGQKSAGGAKSMVLLFDTFHLGRIAFWDSLIKSLGIKTFKAPFPSYRKGVTLLDTSLGEIQKMADAGEIPKEWLPDLTESKRQLDLAVKTGFNVGRISDALHQEWVRALPWIGDFNKFLFDQFQRGAMAESWLLEFERIRRARPEMDEKAAARLVSEDLNIRFGNLGRQGLFRSKTAQDTARFLTLAPQWNEGLIRSELGAIKEAGQFVRDTAQGKRIYAGTLLRSVGGMILAQFAANQIINFATRGHPTWDNPEEGIGAKLSAWVPDVVGSGPGFFIHPLGLAAETTHLLLNAYARTGDFQKTLNQYLRSRSSMAMRPILTFATNTDFLGRTLKPGAVWGEMVKEALPLPIGGSALASAAKQVATQRESETFPGQIQKQVMASVGVKTEQAPSPGQRISKLAEEYNKAHGVERPAWQGPVGDYQALTSALRIGNESASAKEMDKLLEKRKASEIANHYREWPRSAFTGRRSREGDFVRSLTPEQAATYDKARQERVEIGRKALILLRDALAKKQAAESETK